MPTKSAVTQVSSPLIDYHDSCYIRFINMEAYRQESAVINWKHPAILEQAKKLASENKTSEAIAKACFEWVRDEIRRLATIK